MLYYGSSIPEMLGFGLDLKTTIFVLDVSLDQGSVPNEKGTGTLMFMVNMGV